MRNILEKYLISIEASDSLRLKGFFSQKIFKENKLSFKVFGVKGADLSTLEYFKLAVANKEKALSPAELGCTLSHIQAMENFLKTEQQYAIFFEDDVIQKQDFSLIQLEQKIIELNLKSSFLLSLGGIQLSFSEKVKGTFFKNKLFGQNIIAIHPYYYKNLSSTYAYIIDRSMAKILIQYHQPPRGCDHWGGLSLLEKVPNLYATYLFDHPEVINNQTQSYIEKERLELKVTTQNKSQKNMYSMVMSKIQRLKLEKYNVD